MVYEFRWNAWNIGHIAEHGVSPEEAEYVVRRARRPFPRREGERKFLVRGQTEYGEYLQVIFVVDLDKSIYVIHARPLSDSDKKRFRRGMR